jgi:hypothetical protein
VSICEKLLLEPMLEEAVRAGDCLAMLVEHFHDAGDLRGAYRYIQEMEGRGIAVHPYIDAEVLDAVMKVAPSKGNRRGSKQGPRDLGEGKGTYITCMNIGTYFICMNVYIILLSLW